MNCFFSSEYLHRNRRQVKSDFVTREPTFDSTLLNDDCFAHLIGSLYVQIWVKFMFHFFTFIILTKKKLAIYNSFFFQFWFCMQFFFFFQFLEHPLFFSCCLIKRCGVVWFLVWFYIDRKRISDSISFFRVFAVAPAISPSFVNC